MKLLPPVFAFERGCKMSVRPNAFLAALFAAALFTVSCGGGSSPSGSAPGSSSSTTPTANKTNVSLDKNAYPVFPNADAGADPSVPAEQGGKGFKGEGWETNTSFDLIGDPRAVKGGTFREYLLDFPNTMRIFGPDVTAFNFEVQTMVYETLLGLHPTTLDYIPSLASHWQISPDKLTYRFRLDPNARFSNGEPVTADDVVASFNFLMDKGLQERMVVFFTAFEKPVAESKYIVRVHAKELNWQNFMHFSDVLPILPSSVLKTIDGARYVKEYNFKMIPGSGPYIVTDTDVVKGKSVSLRRRKDYWAEDRRANVGTGNFDELREIIVRDQNLAFEMFKKGDLDDYPVNISRQWVQEMNFDKVQQGVILKRKIFNDSPGRIQGLAINTRRPPYDDIRVRQALNYLFNRRELIQRLFFNEYVPLNSFFVRSVYENKNNPKNEYDPQKALALLGQVGWNSRDAQGRLVKNGQPLAIEIMYGAQSAERSLTVYQEDLRKVGITLNLRLTNGETLISLVGQRKFELVDWGWIVPPFPDPDTEYRSALADLPNSNNITGFKDKHVDDLLDQYNKEFDLHKRIAMIQELDGILANAYQYVLEWDAPFHRIAYWNKFGQPEGYLSRTGEDFMDMPTLWWLDPAKEQQLNRALGDPSIKLDQGQVEVRYWEDFDKRQSSVAAAPK
jgi:microcin C transport system substrate-binding protein